MQLLSGIYCNNFRLLSGVEIYYLKSFLSIFSRILNVAMPLMAQMAQIEKIVITQLKKVQMLRRIRSRVIDRCRLQICSQISFNNNKFVDIRCLIFN